MKKYLTNKKGFTLLEIIVSLSLFAFLMLLVNSMFVVSQNAYNQGSDEGELIQNARVSMDRISRELRQADDIVTLMPINDTDISFPPVNEIFFQDGHDVNKINYIRYYLNGTDLMRARIAYYFSIDPSVYVRWDSLDASSNPPQSVVLEDRIVGEYFNNLRFWGDNGLINLSAQLIKKRATLNIDTRVFSRN